MNKELSVHDNILLAYTVDLKKREIVFQTEYPHDPPEFTDVIFSGVDCYSFKHDSVLGTIIFDFEDATPLGIYDDFGTELIAGIPWGWPGDWAKTRESAAEFFAEEGIKAWYLASSLGMTGWILARSMEKR
jgi:hypothetical protein